MFEKLWHVPGNLEGYMHVPGCAHAQKRPTKAQADLEVLHKQEVKAKTELESSCLNVEGVPQRLTQSSSAKTVRHPAPKDLITFLFNH